MENYFDNFKPLNYYTIYNKITDEDIFKWLFNIPEVNTKIKIANPHRKDKTPGCFFQLNGDRWKFIDNNWIPDYFAFSALDALKVAYNLDDMYSVYKLLDAHFKITNSKDKLVIRNTYDRNDKGSNMKIAKSYDYKLQNFTKFDKEFWEQYNIGLDTLKFYNVKSCVNFRTNTGLSLSYNEKNPMYIYDFGDGIFKLYRPYSNIKWLSNQNNKPEGYLQLPEKGEYLIITSSLKDVMALNTVGFWAIAPNSETSSIDNRLLDELEKRFDNIIVIMDNDLKGIESSNKKCYSKYKKVFMNFKDPSDQIKYGGIESICEILNVIYV